MISKLDNPVGNALAEVHSKFCLDYNNYKFYKPENCVFGSGSGFLPELKEYDNSFFIVGDKPVLSEYFQENGVVACDQMVMDSLSELEFTEEIVPLENNHKEELFALVDLVQPGYFKKDTADLGDYFGIFKDGKLAAVTGERMKMDGFTEISAVVAHPQHHRKGYAKQLVVYTAQKIINENKIPFLHVAEGNLNAIALYERLGFKFRRKMNFWKMSKR